VRCGGCGRGVGLGPASAPLSPEEDEEEEEDEDDDDEAAEREAERTARHEEYLAEMKQAKKERRPMPGPAPVGEYMIDCEAIEGEWPDMAEDMALSIRYDEALGAYAATFDFGIIQGVIIMSEDEGFLDRLSKRRSHGTYHGERETCLGDPETLTTTMRRRRPLQTRGREKPPPLKAKQPEGDLRRRRKHLESPPTFSFVCDAKKRARGRSIRMRRRGRSSSIKRTSPPSQGKWECLVLGVLLLLQDERSLSVRPFC